MQDDDQIERDFTVEAHMILLGRTGLLPTIEHLRALEDEHEVRLITIANEIERVKNNVLNAAYEDSRPQKGE